MQTIDWLTVRCCVLCVPSCCNKCCALCCPSCLPIPDSLDLEYYPLVPTIRHPRSAPSASHPASHHHGISPPALLLTSPAVLHHYFITIHIASHPHSHLHCHPHSHPHCHMHHTTMRCRTFSNRRIPGGALEGVTPRLTQACHQQLFMLACSSELNRFIAGYRMYPLLLTLRIPSIALAAVVISSSDLRKYSSRADVLLVEHR